MSLKAAVNEAKQALKSGDDTQIEQALQSLEATCGGNTTETQKMDKIVLRALLKQKLFPKGKGKKFILGGGLVLLAAGLLLYGAGSNED